MTSSPAGLRIRNLFASFGLLHGVSGQAYAVLILSRARRQYLLQVRNGCKIPHGLQMVSRLHLRRKTISRVRLKLSTSELVLNIHCQIYQVLLVDFQIGDLIQMNWHSYVAQGTSLATLREFTLWTNMATIGVCCPYDM